MQGLQPALFLDRYWQREPLLLRAAVPGFVPPVSADELAGLAMEDEVESRIAECNGAADNASSWQLHHGPFVASDFLRPHPWTLLIQRVDQLLDEVAELRRLTDFIPRWRLDDIMVSYATDGGGIGPHYDLYDVFLLQGEGERTWRIGQRCNADTPLLAHDDLKLLAHFDCQAEYTLRCGDALYIPPGVAHWGISRGESTCFSLGFRAPRMADLLSRLTDSQLERTPDNLLLRDAGRETASRCGEITAADSAQAREQIQALLASAREDSWFGELVTESNSDPLALKDVLQLTAHVQDGYGVRLAPDARVAWQHTDREGLRVFANGASCTAPEALRDWLARLCADHVVHWPGGENTMPVLQFLMQQGALDVE